MTQSLIDAACVVAQFLLAFALVCAAIRLIIGPRAQDRVLALDTLYVDAMLLILGFVSTAAVAKFLLRGEVIE